MRLDWKLSAASLFLLVSLETSGALRPVQTAQTSDKTITETDCTATKLGTSIPTSSIGEPVSAVTLKDPKWVAATTNAPSYCSRSEEHTSELQSQR